MTSHQEIGVTHEPPEKRDPAKRPPAAPVTSRERVFTALAGGQPDRVPYCELGVDRVPAQQLLGTTGIAARLVPIDENPYCVEENKKVARILQMDNIEYDLGPKVYADVLVSQDNSAFYGAGQIRDFSDLERVILPTRCGADDTFSEARLFAEQKDDYALFFVTRIGILSAMLSMGTEDFCLALFDKPYLVKSLIEKYVDWTIVAAEKAAEVGFDVFVSTDDMAFKTGPFFSPRIFEQLLLPHFQRVARYITLPWILHTDGNAMPYMEDLISLGIAGFHPNEKGAVDIRFVKQRYGHRICVMGNVDVDLLTRGSCAEAEVEAEVRGLMRDHAPGGGYILTSGNSLTSYVNPDNAVAMSNAVQRYGHYPICV